MDSTLTLTLTLTSFTYDILEIIGKKCCDTISTLVLIFNKTEYSVFGQFF
jgi:hypothetical protein